MCTFATWPLGSMKTVVGHDRPAPREAACEALGFEDAGVGDRVLRQEPLRVSPVVLRIEAEEGDLLFEFLRLALEERELELTVGAPGGPLVDDNGHPLQGAELVGEWRVDHLIGLAAGVPCSSRDWTFRFVKCEATTSGSPVLRAS
jgi:hypothetical protein